MLSPLPGVGAAGHLLLKGDDGADVGTNRIFDPAELALGAAPFPAADARHILFMVHEQFKVTESKIRVMFPTVIDCIMSQSQATQSHTRFEMFS